MNRKNHVICLMIILLLGPPFNIVLHGKEKQRVAVFDFLTENLPISYAIIARNSTEYHLYKNKDFKLLKRNRVKMVFNKYKVNQYNCYDNDCIVTFGKSLLIDYVIVGKIIKRDNYTITMKVISIAEEEELASYSESFKTEKRIDRTVARILSKLSVDVKKDSKDVNAQLFKSLNFHLSAYFNYLLPTGEFKNRVNPGFGPAFGMGIDNIMMRNTSLYLETGLYKFTGKINNSDTLRFIPFQMYIGYSILLPFKISITPLIAAGLNYITLVHKSGNGFSMEENSEKNGIEQLYIAGILINYDVFKHLQINTGCRYGMVYESQIMDFIIFNIGLRINF